MSEVLQSLNQSGVQYLLSTPFQAGGFNTQPLTAPSPGGYPMQPSPAGYQMQPSPGGYQMQPSPGGYQMQPMGFPTAPSAMRRLDITPREWWEQEIASIGLNKRKYDVATAL